MFGFLKPKPWTTTYEQPLLLAKSDLPGFNDFIQCGFLRCIKLISEEEIPDGVMYFKYVGKGQIAQFLKYKMTNSSLPPISHEDRTRVKDYSNQLGDFSPKWKQDELSTLIFQLREQKLMFKLHK